MADLDSIILIAIYFFSRSGFSDEKAYQLFYFDFFCAFMKNTIFVKKP